MTSYRPYEIGQTLAFICKCFYAFAIDLFTDSDAIMKSTVHIPACIGAIKHLLISSVIKKR